MSNPLLYPLLPWGDYRGFTTEGCPYTRDIANPISQIPYLPPMTPGGG